MLISSLCEPYITLVRRWLILIRKRRCEPKQIIHCVHTKHRECLDEGQTPASPTVRYNSGHLQHLLGGVHVDGAPQEPEAPPSCITRMGSEPVPVDRRSSMKNEPNERIPMWVRIFQICSSSYRVEQTPLTVQIMSIIMHCIK